MSAMNYGTTVPTVTNGTCASGSSCAAGSLCTSTSQCATGNCCAYILNFPAFSSLTTQYASSISENPANAVITSKSQTAYNALIATLYTNKYCLSSVSGTSTTSYFNATSSVGMATTSGATNTFIVYACNMMFLYQKAEMVQVMFATLLAAVSALYIA